MFNSPNSKRNVIILWSCLLLIISSIFIKNFDPNFDGYCKSEGKILTEQELLDNVLIYNFLHIHKKMTHFEKKKLVSELPDYPNIVRLHGVLENGYERWFGRYFFEVETYGPQFDKTTLKKEYPYRLSNYYVNSCGEYVDHISSQDLTTIEYQANINSNKTYKERYKK